MEKIIHTVTLLLYFLKIILNIIFSYLDLFICVLHILFSFCDALLNEISKLLQEILFEQAYYQNFPVLSSYAAFHNWIFATNLNHHPHLWQQIRFRMLPNKNHVVYFPEYLSLHFLECASEHEDSFLPVRFNIHRGYLLSRYGICYWSEMCYS